MLVDSIAGPAGDLADHHPQTRIIYLVRPATARTDHVMVVGPLADDIGMFAGRQVQALDRAEHFEDLQRTEYGGPPHAKPTGSRFGQEVASREVAVAARDQGGERPPRLRQAVAGAVKHGDD